MSWVATAIIGGAVIGGAATYYSSQEQADAAKQAASLQAGTADAQAQAQLAMFNTNRADMAPWRDVGKQGLYSLADLMGIQSYQTQASPIPPDVQGQIDDLNRQIGSWQDEVNRTKADPGRGSWEEKQAIVDKFIRQRDALSAPYTSKQVATPHSANFGMLTRPFSMADYQADPGYAFRLEQGQKSIDNAQLARGNFFSGGALKESQRYNQDMASNEFANAYNRYNQNQSNIYNRLGALSGTGQTSAQQIAAQGAQAQGLAGNYMMQGAQAQGQGLMDMAQARGSMYTGMANQFTGGLGAYMNYKQNQDYMKTLRDTGYYG